MYARNDVASVMSTRNDVKAAVLWRQIRQSMRIHSMNNPAIFHPDRIWNALCFFGRGRPNRISSEMVPDPKIPRPTVDTSRSPVPVPTNLSRSNWKKQVRINCCIGVRSVYTHQVVALFCVKWRHGRQLESMTSNRISDSANRCVFTWRTLMQTTEPFKAFLNRVAQQEQQQEQED